MKELNSPCVYKVINRNIAIGTAHSRRHMTNATCSKLQCWESIEAKGEYSKTIGLLVIYSVVLIAWGRRK